MVLWESIGLWTNRIGRNEAESLMDDWWDSASLTEVEPSLMGDVTLKLYLEQVVCSCGSLGFIPHNLSTVSSGVDILRNGNLCHFGSIRKKEPFSLSYN